MDIKELKIEIFDLIIKRDELQALINQINQDINQKLQELNILKNEIIRKD